MKWKSFCKAQDTIKRTKWQHIEWGTIFTKSISERELISKIYNCHQGNAHQRTLRFNLTPVKTAKTKTTSDSSCW